jgi:hypothetical protein
MSKKFSRFLGLPFILLVLAGCINAKPPGWDAAGKLGFPPNLCPYIVRCGGFESHAMASNYLVNKKLAAIRARQQGGEMVRIVTILLTPTLHAGTQCVAQEKVRPGWDKSLLDIPAGAERERAMTKMADKIVAIADKLGRGPAPVPRSAADRVTEWEKLPRPYTDTLVGRDETLRCWAGRSTARDRRSGRARPTASSIGPWACWADGGDQ